MNLAEMIALVRTDLHDEDESNYRWTDAELTRHIGRAVGELSESLPLPAKATLATTTGSREIDIGGLSDRIMVAALEYPLAQTPPSYRQFSVWGETLTITDGNAPDGSDCVIYYGARHVLDDDGSTLPAQYDDLVAGGAAGYAAVEQALFTVNRVNVGGVVASSELREWGNQKLKNFRNELRRLGRRNRVRSGTLFTTETQ